MKSVSPIDWPETTAAARQLQLQLQSQVRTTDDFHALKLVAGADIALSPTGNRGIAGVIVYQFPELIEVERVSAEAPLRFPYIPGLLSFREGPILCAAFAKLQHRPDMILFDGQGIAHPRGVGLASHMGLIMDVPTIGCAKSRLVGDYREPDLESGSSRPLYYNDKQVGAVVRTRDKVKPIYVSPGHRISIQTAVDIVLQCCDGLRIPKPTREADRWVGELKRMSS